MADIISVCLKLWLLSCLLLLVLASSCGSQTDQQQVPIQLLPEDAIDCPDSVFVGEAFLIRVDTEKFGLGGKAKVSINGIEGAPQYRQLIGIPGPRYILATATVGRRSKSQSKVIWVEDIPSSLRPFPIIESTESRYSPRTVAFRIGNGNDTTLEGAIYHWDFGDGTYGQSETDDVIEHDYTEALQRDELTTQFNVTVLTGYPDGSNVTVNRTVSVFNLYAYNKQKAGILSPRTKTMNLADSNGSIRSSWAINVTNIEDVTLILNYERIELLDSTPDTPTYFQPPVPVNLTIPPHSDGQLFVDFPTNLFAGSVFGFAVHINGTAEKTGMPVDTSAYVKVKSPYNLGGRVTDPEVIAFLNLIKPINTPGGVLSHRYLENILGQLRPFREMKRLPLNTTRPYSKSLIEPPRIQRTRPGLFKPTAISQSLIKKLLAGGIQTNLKPRQQMNKDFEIGAECDPNNVPDNLPDGIACQFTGQTAWDYAPGMIVNAHKGDVLLSPGGGAGLIGKLLSNVNPAQYYSHCGIMTKNFIEVRHSTAEQSWLEDHPKGFMGSGGFEENAMKYGWPGTITQTIDHSVYGEPMTAENGRSYLVSALSYDPNRGDDNTLITPLVMKPPPQLETLDVRLKLHNVASSAEQIDGHYRFYMYTYPQLAMSPGGIAPSDAGWAAGKVATVCSSFIWLACHNAGIQLEGSNPLVTASDFESNDVGLGAQANAETLDGLYLYTANERQDAAKWLWTYVYNAALGKTPGWVTPLVPGIVYQLASNIANMFVNTFAFDNPAASGPPPSNPLIPFPITSINLITEANAVSPDNMLLWDSPGTDNRNGFQSIYGGRQDAHYSPGDFKLVDIYVWTFHPTKGTVSGRVIMPDGSSVAGCDVSISGQPDIYVGTDGAFSFLVPEGWYTISAGMPHNGMWYSTKLGISIAAGETTAVTLSLQPPPEVHRLITINVQMTVMKKGWGACGDCDREFSFTQSRSVYPWHETNDIDFQAMYPDGSGWNGYINFPITLSPDLSITVQYSAQIRKGTDVDHSYGGVFNVAKDSEVSYTGLWMRYKNAWHTIEVSIDWTVDNALGST